MLVIRYLSRCLRGGRSCFFLRVFSKVQVHAESIGRHALWKRGQTSAIRLYNSHYIISLYRDSTLLSPRADMYIKARENMLPFIPRLHICRPVFSVDPFRRRF